jgi:hypothetical protein
VPKQYYGFTDDAAGFNGGTSLSIISSVYAKGVKRVQNALIQAITDAINLFLLNRGLKSYLNNFTLKMKAPMTQEEKDYREGLNNKVNAISSIQGLFTDIEDKSRRLRILKTLLTSLNFGDDINVEIDAEIKAIEDAAVQAEEEAALEGTEGIEETSAEKPEAETEAEPVEDTDLGSLDALESFNTGTGDILLEDQTGLFLIEEDLPSPADLDSEKDFSENN